MSTLRPTTSRRRFLVRSGAGLIALSGVAAAGCEVLISPGPRDAAAELIGLLHRHDLARRLGRSYVESAAPGEPSLEPLTRELLEDLGFDLDELMFLRVGDLARAVAEQVRRDFAEGRVVSVDGWMLSEAEARVCAILHLYEPQEAS